MDAMSRFGGSPNIREYSRLKWDGLSYPTSKTAVSTLLSSATSRTASLGSFSKVAIDKRYVVTNTESINRDYRLNWDSRSSLFSLSGLTPIS
jgi:hypothetical protein